MFTKSSLRFLSQLGLNDIQINIYNYLLNHERGTINEIKAVLNYSYAQVYHNINGLVEKELIVSSQETPSVYTLLNPDVALNELIDKKTNSVKEKVESLKKEWEINKSKKGKCVKDVPFYYYSDKQLAVSYFYELIGSAQKEIILNTLPTSFLKRLEPAFYSAFMNGVNIIFYFTPQDIPFHKNYLDCLTDIFKRIKLTLVRVQEGTCQLVRYNNQIVNQSHILIDEYYFNSIAFNEEGILNVNGFISPEFINQMKQMFENKSIEKKLEMDYPIPIQDVLNAIKTHRNLKTRDISQKTKISGTRLREILDFLLSRQEIEELKLDDGSVGRPKKVYNINNK